MSWNKYNLYNAVNSEQVQQLVSERAIRVQGLFAQRQKAKLLTRKYHGQGLRERIFTKQLYTSKFNVVAGGTPKGVRFMWAGFYMNVERRLDTVIFRSLFATSIEQARQLIKHGHVDVNGVKVITMASHDRPTLTCLPYRRHDRIFYLDLETSTMPILKWSKPTYPTTSIHTLNCSTQCTNAT